MTALRRPKVLVVDDQPDVRQLVVDWLNTSGFEAIAAAGGEAALTCLEDGKPDLVLLDVMMPGMDGYEVLRRIRLDPRLAYLPVLLLTALSSSRQVIDGLTRGADDYIPKPFSLDELKARIETHLRRSRRERQLNPLTLLPGNLAIEQAIEDRLRAGRPMAVLLLDLDNFKAFNDRYGFFHGDQVIQFLGAVIADTVAKLGGPSGFVGQIGGDDFLAIVPPELAESVCQEIIRRFDARIAEYYAPEDAARGEIEGHTRRGEVERFPLTSVSIAVVVHDRERKLRHVAEVSHIAAQLKNRLKALPGSSYLMDRRGR